MHTAGAWHGACDCDIGIVQHCEEDLESDKELVYATSCSTFTEHIKRFDLINM